MWEPLPGTPAPPEAVGRSLERVLRSLGGPRVDVVQQVFSRWPELVGEDLASVTEPESLHEGCLVVSVGDPAWASSIGFRRPELLDRLAEVLGPGVVGTIEVRVRARRR